MGSSKKKMADLNLNLGGQTLLDNNITWEHIRGKLRSLWKLRNLVIFSLDIPMEEGK